MGRSKLGVVAVLITLAVLASRHWERGVEALDRALGGGPDAAGGLDVRLHLGFKGSGGWIAEGEDRKVYLLGSVKNPTAETIDRLVLAARIDDAGAPGEPVAQELVLGPFAPGEKVEYADLVSYLLPKGQDEWGNEVFEFSYELEVVAAE